MKVLVTGAAGFIGNHLTKSLIASGYEVILLDRNPQNLSSNLLNEFKVGFAEPELIAADLADIEQTGQILNTEQPEIVIHLASSGVSNAGLPLDQALNDNLFGTLNLIRACFETQAGSRPAKLIIARTPGELTAMNVYAASKAAAWNFCSMFARTKNYPIFGAMFYQVYGPNQPEKLVIPSAFQAALRNQDFPMTSGSQMKDWIYIDDVISGLHSLITVDLEPGATVELGTGKATPLLTVIQKVFILVGGSGKPLPGYIEDRVGEETLQEANIKMTKTQISWTPKVSLEEGLAKYHGWLVGQS